MLDPFSLPFSLFLPVFYFSINENVFLRSPPRPRLLSSDSKSASSIFRGRKPCRAFNWAQGISIFVRCNMQSSEPSNRMVAGRRLHRRCNDSQGRLVDKFYLLLVTSLVSRSPTPLSFVPRLPIGSDSTSVPIKRSPTASCSWTIVSRFICRVHCDKLFNHTQTFVDTFMTEDVLVRYRSFTGTYITRS